MFKEYQGIIPSKCNFISNRREMTLCHESQRYHRYMVVNINCLVIRIKFGLNILSCKGVIQKHEYYSDCFGHMPKDHIRYKLMNIQGKS
jgi:hypothetical protein